MMKNKKKDFLPEIVFWCVSIILLMYLLLYARYNTLWFDEAITAIICKQSLSSIIEWAGVDYHPPLYYIFLHAVYKVFGESVLAFTMLSLLPIFFIVFVTRVIVCEEFGYFSGSLYILFWGMMPQSIYNLAEVRMYSWGGLFLTLSLIGAYEIIKHDKNPNYIVFFIVGVLGAYTHYFVLVHLFFIYVFLFFYQVKEKNGKGIRNVVLCALATAIAYLPWISKLWSATSMAKEAFWQTELLTVKEGISLLFGTKGLFGVFIVLILYNIYLCIKNHRIDFRVQLMICGIVSIIGTMAFGYIFSYFVHPMYHQRYIYYASVILWLVFSIGVGIKDDNICNVFAGVSFLICVFLNSSTNLYTLKIQKMGFNYLKNIYELYDDDSDIYIYKDNHATWVFRYYMPDAKVERFDNLEEIDNEYNGWIVADDSIEDVFINNKISYELIVQGVGGAFKNIYEVP